MVKPTSITSTLEFKYTDPRACDAPHIFFILRLFCARPLIARITPWSWLAPKEGLPDLRKSHTLDCSQCAVIIKCIRSKVHTGHQLSSAGCAGHQYTKGEVTSCNINPEMEPQVELRPSISYSVASTHSSDASSYVPPESMFKNARQACRHLHDALLIAQLLAYPNSHTQPPVTKPFQDEHCTV